ncbi:hypothetical protein PM082_018666 [Marasmius tenuissimus]|nr:hypothetical protein PM082_018666 [Marasmius tenuissimus]
MLFLPQDHRYLSVADGSSHRPTPELIAVLQSQVHPVHQQLPHNPASPPFFGHLLSAKYYRRTSSLTYSSRGVRRSFIGKSSFK